MPGLINSATQPHYAPSKVLFSSTSALPPDKADCPCGHRTAATSLRDTCTHGNSQQQQKWLLPYVPF